MFDDFFLKKGTESFLKGTLLLIEAAVPQSNPRLVKSTLESFPLAIHMTLKDQQSESLLVSPQGWFWKGDGTGQEIVSLECDTRFDASLVLMVFYEKYLRYWVGTIIPDGEPIEIGRVGKHLGQGSRNYEILNEILKYFLMIKDGVFEDSTAEIRQYAAYVLDWMSGKN